MKRKYFIFFISMIIFLAVIFTCLIVFSSNTNKENETTQKAEEELNYLETKILGMLNSLNNIPFSNSVLLEQNSIKGQSNSANTQSSSSGSQSSGGEKGSSSEGSSGSSSSGGSSSSSENSQGKDYTKYSVANENILIQTNQEIDWDYLKNTVEVLYGSWPTIMIDLHSLNIKNEDILTFSNQLDTLVINIQTEDKRTTLNSLAILYELLPIYKSQFLNDSNNINVSYTKSYIANSYVVLEDQNWTEMQNQITKAQEYFGLVINSVDENKHQSDINKSYVLLNEMSNAINLKDKNLFFLKYKNLMETLLKI